SLSYEKFPSLTLDCKYLTDFSCNSCKAYCHVNQCSSVSAIMSWNSTRNASEFNPPTLSSCGSICGSPLMSCIAPLTGEYWSLNAASHRNPLPTLLISGSLESSEPLASITAPGDISIFSAVPGGVLSTAVNGNISNLSESMASSFI